MAFPRYSQFHQVVLLLLAPGLLCYAPEKSANPSAFVAASRDRVAIEAAIETERPTFQPPTDVTGITVPHHLLAADLVARGFWAASANSYDRIVLIGPDHFRWVQGHFAVVPEPLKTVFGAVPIDTGAVGQLLTRPDLFETAVDAENEHGLMSVAPFIRYFFPDTPVVAVVASIESPREVWDSAASVLATIITDRTLIIQSTDYSHYLPLSDSIQRDQETLATIAARDRDWISGLLQPGHLDSRAAQYLQLVLQERRLGGSPVVIANRNSVEYGSSLDATTSYVVTVFVRDRKTGSTLSYQDQQLIYFAGDTLLGRYFTPILRDREAVDTIVSAVLDITRGAPLVINLEGVVIDEPVVGLPAGSHLMRGEAAIPVMQRLNVVAAGMANNHSQDLGPTGLEASREALTRIGIAPLLHAQTHDLGGLRLVPLTFHRGRYPGSGAIETTADLDALCAIDVDPPLVALVHWGTEYTNEASAEEREAALALHACGVSLVVGAHSHQASTRIEPLAGGATQLVYSLGNFLFDQTSDRTSGALLEVRAFHQGTVAARLVPLPNLFDPGGPRRTLGLSARGHFSRPR